MTTENKDSVYHKLNQDNVIRDFGDALCGDDSKRADVFFASPDPEPSAAPCKGDFRGAVLGSHLQVTQWTNSEVCQRTRPRSRS
jgi:hypothetical protein